MGVVFLIVCLTVGFLSYHFGVSMAFPSEAVYDDGYTDGIEAGRSEGFNQGFNQGNASGYSSGYTVGYNVGYASVPIPTKAPDRYNEGYDAGVSTGKSQGYNEGFSAGNTAGFSSGYSAGYVNGTKDGAGTGYTIRDPTYAEMQNFIALDRTDSNIYNENTYNCYDFTHDVLTNAFNAGIKAGFVYIEFAAGSHAIAVFNTVDNGLVYIEPQSDEIMTVAIGAHYWDRAIYGEPDYDDTIVEFGIIW